MNHTSFCRSLHGTKALISRHAPCRQSIRHYLNPTNSSDKVLLKHLLAMKKRKEPIAMITCYDASQAVLADIAKVDTVLVGDSCANVMMGLNNTNQITMDGIVHHLQCVSRGLHRGYLIGDMPFGSYLTPDDAIRNAARLVSEGGASCVKMEGFVPEAVREISRFIPVCGHLGLLPQTTDCFGTRGRTQRDIKELLEQSLRIQDEGASLLVLEKVTAESAALISQSLEIPTIGIGSGRHCDGQVLVWHDLLGLGHPQRERYKFVKRFGDFAPSMVSAIEQYIDEVKGGAFPAAKHSYFLPQKRSEEMKALFDGISVDHHDDDEKAEGGRSPAIIRSGAELRRRRGEMDRVSGSRKIVFVPFLGGLHEGHLALIEAARARGSEYEIWCSLFVNPLQFNEAADFLKYPHDAQQDIAKLTALGVDVIFTPSVHEMYPHLAGGDLNDGSSSSNSALTPFVDFEDVELLTEEGRCRPGHFKGVGTVVTTLFSWIRPDVAVFGQKDFMQCILIQNLCRQFFPDLEIVVHGTVREEDGLAMSSRNTKLSETERERAPLIYRTLSVIASALFDQIHGDEAVPVRSATKIGLEFAKQNG